MSAVKPLWTPSQARIESALVTRFAREAIRDWGLGLNDYPAFYRWSADHPEQFWQSVWRHCGVRGDPGRRILEDGDRMPGAKFFPDGRLNFAENLLRRRDSTDAMVFWGEDKVKRRVTHAGLYAEVSRLAQALRAAGVTTGDRVAGYLPNMPEAVTGMLAASEPRCDLVLVLARFRRAGRARPVRPDRAEGAHHRRWLLVQRKGGRHPRQGARDRRQAAIARAGHRRAVSRRGAGRDDGAEGGSGWRISSTGFRRARHRVRPAAVQPPALHPLLVGDDRGSQVHRARRRRHAPEAPVRAAAAFRRPARRSALLLHHLRLDDVELVGFGARVGGDVAALRRLAVRGRKGGSSSTTPTPSA